MKNDNKARIVFDTTPKFKKKLKQKALDNEMSLSRYIKMILWNEITDLSEMADHEEY